FTDDQVLDVVLDLVFETVRADQAVAFLYDIDGKLTPRAVRRRDPEPPQNEDDEPVKPEPIRASRTILTHVVRTGEGVVCSNAMTDRRFRSGHSVQNLGIRSAIACPIKARRLDAGVGKAPPIPDTADALEVQSDENEVIGVLYVDSSVQNYTYGTDQLRLLTAIGLQTGLALQNAKLYRKGLQAERLAAVGETTAALSHSIKNILQALRGGASVVEMARKRKDWNQLDKGWGVVDRNLDRIFGLTMNLLAFSKPRTPSRKLVNPRQVINECVDLVAPMADERGVMVVADVADDQPAVPLDEEGLHQVLMNLLGNAVDAVSETEPEVQTAPTGVVKVICRYDAEQKRTNIDVVDDGPGVDPNLRRHMFELFHSTKGNRGTGLGLPVAKKIIEEHDGTLTVKSDPGHGTTFSISLPAFVEQSDDPSHTYVGLGG
ncbi:MAG: GAF domain-containing sensor histidine kinase, partial [Planctomycetota bacterium]